MAATSALLGPLPADTPELPFRKSSIVPQKPPQKLRRKLTNIYSDNLNVQQWRFVEYYMQSLKPYDAAKKAEYSEATCLVAHDVLLNNPAIQTEIQTRLDRHFKEAGITEQRITQNVLRLAESNLFDYGFVDPSTGHFKVDLRNVPRELGYAIQEYSFDAQGRPRIKLVDKLAAHALLGKFKGMGTEKLQLTGKDGGPLTIQALDAIVQQTNVIINQQINNNITTPQELPEKVINAELVATKGQ